MKFKGILFDINGTLVDILTDESRDDIYRTISNFMRYQGITIDAGSLKKDYFARLQRQKKLSGEQYPEFDAVTLWKKFLQEHLPKGTKRRSRTAKLKNMPHFLAEMYRAASMYKLQLYPGVTEVLTSLADQYRLAALSDAQSAWAMPELRAVGLAVFFESVIVSGDLGYRKPDPRIFSLASHQMQLPLEDILFVGNDMYRDIYGAQETGMKTVFFASNQGRTKYRDTEADYIIYSFRELPTAISFLENK